VGKFVDQLSGEDSNGYPLPAGTWHLVVTDAGGKTLLDKQSQQPANGDPYFVYYWPDVPAGETMSAVTTFTPTAASAGNFTMTSQKFSYASAPAAGSPADSPRQPTPHPAVAASDGVPAWIYAAVLAVALILAAIVIVLLVRRKPSTRPSAKASTGGESIA
jgi:hypothetical protein